MGSTQSSPSDKLSRQQEYDSDLAWYQLCVKRSCYTGDAYDFFPCEERCKKVAFPVCKYPELHSKEFFKLRNCKPEKLEKIKF